MDSLTFPPSSVDNAEAVSPWVPVLLSLCAVGLTIALVLALLALRRAALGLERVLARVEQEIAPLAAECRAIGEDVRMLTREASQEVERVRSITNRIDVLLEGVARLLVAVGGLTRVGQVVGIIAGVRKGVDVFVKRLQRHQGDQHG